MSIRTTVGVLTVSVVCMWTAPAWAQQQLLPASSPDYPVETRTVLIGDAGGADQSGTTPGLDLLRAVLSDRTAPSNVIFLGDNIYCCGLPDSSSPDRAFAESRLVAQLSATESASGRIVFIPGNHDWGPSGAYDADIVRRQERFVEAYLDRGNTFLPDDGLAGPHDIRLSASVRLVAIDTQWWLMDGSKPRGESDDYDVSEDGDLLLALADLLIRRDDDIVILAAHHPILSQGRHGGRYPLKDHLFPLTQIWDNAYFPFPLFGSLVPVLRTAWGAEQDLSNERYSAFSEAVLSLMEQHPGRIIYAAGHEHGLQHTPVSPSAHVLVSGAGSRPDWVASGAPASFTFGGAGLLVVDVLEDGTTHLYALGVHGSSGSFERMYSTILFPAAPIEVDSVRTVPTPILPDSLSSSIDTSLEAGRWKRTFLGDHHRSAWALPVTAPVFDVATVGGGLRPTKRGGGLQTTSIRLEDADGYEFVLRSLNKDAAKTIPEPFRETLAKEVFHDQTSAIFPYAALMVPPLARAAGVLFATPSLYYVPRDARFGPFEDTVADQLMLFEQRPDNDMSAFPTFGHSEEVVSASSMYRDLLDDNDNRVDALLFARSRLFDMLISDWDRHQDQWRWASYDDPDGKGTLYKPIPRDRDWAFNRMNGVIPAIIKSPFVLPKFQDFRPEFGFLRGLNQNGMSQDRRLTSALSREDWIAEAQRIQMGMSPAAIDSALTALPPEARPLMEPGFREAMASRLGALPDVASEYYDILSSLVDVTGTDKHERFLIHAHGDSVDVIVLKTTKEGIVRNEMYRRSFVFGETEEIRLFGFDGVDSFHFTGDATTPIRIYAIGGTGSDSFLDDSHGNAVNRHFIVMDTDEGSTLSPGGATRDMRSNDPGVNSYDPTNYWFEALMPTVFIERNQDDGLYIGGGVKHTSHRYGRKPYSTFHSVKANVASSTGAFNVLYDGHFPRRLGSWGVRLSADARTPNTVRNFYGLGNETGRNNGDASYYQAQMSLVAVDILLETLLGPGLAFQAGPTFQFVDVRENASRFVTSPQAGVAPTTFDDAFFAGTYASLTADFRNSQVAPTHGFRWSMDGTVRASVSSSSIRFGRFTSDMSWYTPFLCSTRHTMALRAGVQHNVGDFPFYFASTMGGDNTLRGWRRTRFAGRTATHQSLEIRSRLFRFAVPVAAGSGGMLAFIDNGRVWTDGESSRRWHQGTGLGVWANLFDLAVIQTVLSMSEEETVLSFGIGFDY